MPQRPLATDFECTDGAAVRCRMSLTESLIWASTRQVSLPSSDSSTTAHCKAATNVELREGARGSSKPTPFAKVGDAITTHVTPNAKERTDASRMRWPEIVGEVGIVGLCHAANNEVWRPVRPGRSKAASQRYVCRTDAADSVLADANRTHEDAATHRMPVSRKRASQRETPSRK